MIDLGLSILNSILGGVILAVATSAHLLLEGKITGISGMVYKCIYRIDFNYTYSFIAGMFFMSSFIKTLYDPIKRTKDKHASAFLETPTDFASDLTMIGFVFAGFLVGFGSRMGNGCTSGHGICGLPRFSKRSITAIALYLGFGIVTATIRYYIPFFSPDTKKVHSWQIPLLSVAVLIASVLGFSYLLFQSIQTKANDKIRDTVVGFLIGACFSFGLIESGMLQRHAVTGFLTISIRWNCKLLFVLATAVGINIFSFQYIFKNYKTPLFKSKYDLPENTKVDNKLMVGSSIFGLGWGIGGMCPGPAILVSYIYCPQSLLFLAALCGGIYVEALYDKQITEFVNKNEILTKINVFDKIDIDEYVKKLKIN